MLRTLDATGAAARSEVCVAHEQLYGGPCGTDGSGIHRSSEANELDERVGRHLFNGAIVGRLVRRR